MTTEPVDDAARLVAALQSLQAEDSMLTGKISALIARQTKVRNAIEAIQPLMNPEQTVPSTAKLPPLPTWASPAPQANRPTQVELPPWLHSRDKREADNPEDDEDGMTGTLGGRFVGMRFSQALHALLLTLTTPATTSELARQLEDGGWKFKAEQQPQKVNQVGVTLRRFKGKLFESTQDGKWFAMKDEVL